MYSMGRSFCVLFASISLAIYCHALQILSPNETSVWTIGEDQLIQWSTEETLCTVQLKISLKEDTGLGVSNPTIFVFTNELCINHQPFQFRLPLRADSGKPLKAAENYFISVDATNSSYSAVSPHFTIIHKQVETNFSNPVNLTRASEGVVVQPCVINDSKWSSVCSGDWTYAHSGIKRIELQVNRCTSPEKLSMFVSYIWMEQSQSVSLTASLVDGDITVFSTGQLGIYLTLSKVNVHDTYVVFDLGTRVNTLSNGPSIMHIGTQSFGSSDYSVCQLPFTTLCEKELDRCKPSVWYTSAVISAILFVLFVIIATSVAVAVICCCCDDRRKYDRFDEITRKKVKKILKAREFANKRSPSKDALILMETKEKEDV